MYTIDQILKGLKRTRKNPKYLVREINCQAHTYLSGPNYNHNGSAILEEDWDTLLIFDACRYDIFAEHNILPGDLEFRISRGSHTSEFLVGNFQDKELYDTVYTTATPQLARRNDQINVDFHNVYNIWNTNRWDQSVGTVPPDKMTDAAKEAHQSHPHKRHIIHYLQPHYPFLYSNIHTKEFEFCLGSDGVYDVWHQIFQGEIDISSKDIWKAYKKNLDLVLKEAQRLIKSIDGKIVVTSDHGNMIGERASPLPIREWGHPARLYTPELITVPWLIHNSGGRRAIRKDRPKSQGSEINEDKIQDRLKNLGYIS